jgi:hypothetical protein
MCTLSSYFVWRHLLMIGIVGVRVLPRACARARRGRPYAVSALFFSGIAHTWIQTKVGHELLGTCESMDVADYSHQVVGEIEGS